MNRFEFTHRCFKVSLFSILMFICSVPLFSNSLQQQLDSAYESYRIGENTKTVQERKDAFNHALELYSSTEKQLTHPNLYYSIANCYFQLEEYPWAILYYRRVLQYIPRDENSKENLAIAQKKLGLVPDKKNGFLKSIFFFHHGLSISERLQIFFVFISLSFVLTSFYIWWDKRILKKMAFWLGIGGSCVALSLAWSQYFAPLNGVLIRSTALARDAGKQYASVSEEPIRAGETVEVLEVTPNGTWLKIRTGEGLFGYVPNEVIRLI